MERLTDILSWLALPFAPFIWPRMTREVLFMNDDEARLHRAMRHARRVHLVGDVEPKPFSAFRRPAPARIPAIFVTAISWMVLPLAFVFSFRWAADRLWTGWKRGVRTQNRVPKVRIGP